MVHASHPSPGEAEAGGLRICGQFRPQRKILFPKTKPKQTLKFLNITLKKQYKCPQMTILHSRFPHEFTVCDRVIILEDSLAYLF